MADIMAFLPSDDTPSDLKCIAIACITRDMVKLVTWQQGLCSRAIWHCPSYLEHSSRQPLGPADRFSSLCSQQNKVTSSQLH